MTQKSKKIFKKSKKNDKAYFLYGKHPVKMALINQKRQNYKLYVTKKLFEEFLPIANNVEVQIVDENFCDQYAESSSNHQNVILETTRLTQPCLEDFITNKDARLIFILDQVHDPHNIGAILRTAAAFNFDCVINSAINSPDETAVMAKSSSGAIETVPYIKVKNIKSTIDYLKKNGFWCYGLDANGKHNLEKKIEEKVCLVLGSEGKGLRTLVKETCDDLLRIPISQNAESLNISNAAAVAGYCFCNLKN